MPPGEPAGSTARALYDDCASPGEARMVYREEHLCGSCGHATVCAIATECAIREEALILVARCRAYQPTEGAAEVEPGDADDA